MRCLRCAIDYGPDEQFCQRCGRALSRPLGEKPADESSTASPSEARFFYTTTAPPPLQSGSRAGSEKVTWDTPIVQAGAPAVWGSSTNSAEMANGAAEPAAGWDSWAAGKTEDRFPPPPPPRPRPSLPPAKWVEPAAGSPSHPAGDATAPAAEQGAAGAGTLTPAAESTPWIPPADDFFGDDDDDEGSALLSGVAGSAVAGRNSGGKSSRGGAAEHPFGRPKNGTKAADDKWSRSRSLGLVVVVAIVIIALGGYAFIRQRAYNTDLTNARNLALAGQYAGALNDYDKAIADWPFNGDAKAGADAVRGAAAAVQQQAQAAALLRARDNATRLEMYQAHMDLILQEVAGKP